MGRFMRRGGRSRLLLLPAIAAGGAAALGFDAESAWGNQRAAWGNPSVARTAQTYFVSPSGNDSNPGTKSRPWKTIQHAADRLVAGQTVYIRSGTYAERVQPQHSGTPGHFVTFTACPGEAPVIEGASIVLPADQAGLFEISGRSYIRVSRLSVKNAGPDDNSNGILVSGSHHIELLNNRTSNTRSSGIGVWGSRNVVIRGNVIVKACTGGWQESLSVAGTNTFDVANNTVSGTGGGKEGICLKDGSRHGRIQGNLVHDVPAVGIYVDAWDKTTFDIRVYSNVVHTITKYSGIAVASEQGGRLSNIRICNNIVYDSAAIGIMVTHNGVEDRRHPMEDIRIVNNSVWNNGWDWGGGIAVDNPDARDVLVRNNIVSANRTFQLSVSGNVPEGAVRADHNLIDGYRNDLEDGEILGTQYIVGNPRFVNAAKHDFHLRRGSRAIDRGEARYAPTTDFDGKRRPKGAGVDIGAFEY